MLTSTGTLTMHNDPPARATRHTDIAAKPHAAQRPHRPALSGICLAAGLLCSAGAQALEYGPFSLTGFAKAEIVRVSDYCEECALEPFENKQRQWADALVYGREYGADNVTLTLFQPYLGLKFDLPGGSRSKACSASAGATARKTSKASGTTRISRSATPTTAACASAP